MALLSFYYQSICILFGGEDTSRDFGHLVRSELVNKADLK